MDKYTYVIATAFPNGAVGTDRLTEEILNSSIVTVLDHIDTADGNCDIWFASALSGGEQIVLDGLVAAHSGNPIRAWRLVTRDPALEPVEPGASMVVANDRPAIQIEDGVTGFAAIAGVWPLEQMENAELRATIKFIMQAAGTGSNVRLALKAKAQGVGDDSSEAFPYEAFVAVPITYTTLGEVFEGEIVLKVPLFELNAALAKQVGRDGSNSMGAGTNDDANQPIQIIAVKLEAR